MIQGCIFPCRFRYALALVTLWSLLCTPAFGGDERALSQVLVDFDSTWRYHDGDRDLGKAWRMPEFDDQDWAHGPGIVGYETANRRDRWPNPGLKTEITPNLLTYYMRHAFAYQGPRDGVILTLDLIVDDGAVIYLNGEEIGRTSLMPSEETGFGVQTHSPVTVPGIERDVFVIDGELLREGRNVIAASVHNHRTTSSDIAWAARLTVEEATTDPRALYLTWQRDPTTTMTIHWHSGPDDAALQLQYTSTVDAAWERASFVSHAMVHSDRTIHTAKLTELSPGTTYRFRLISEAFGQSSPTYSFHTMPETVDQPIRIAVGGDILHQVHWMEQTNRQAVRFDPDFIIWGGDLAYADGRADRVDRWYSFFDVCRETLIRDDGRVVPIVVAIGNHEILGHYYWGHDRGRDSYENTDAYRESIAPYFYNLFSFPGHPGYGTLDFGDYLSLIVLDTDHSGPVEGAQTQWLHEQLQNRQHMTHVIPVYHVTAFPSVRDYDGPIPTRIREHWVPLFERYGVRLAFEHHDHTYKRTVPIRREQKDPSGIVYIGDGAWGVNIRETHDVDKTWYLERAESIRHFILTTIVGDSIDLKAITIDGELIDHTTLKNRN